MKDQLISLNTAKLAKIKGFPQDEPKGYLPSGKVTGYPETDQSDEDGTPVSWQKILAAPTQSLLQRWIRENHDLELMNKSWKEGSEIIYIHSVNKIGSASKYKVSSKENSFELSLEKALIEALNLI